MVPGLLGAFGAAVCYGVASVLQAVAARATYASEGLDPRLVLRLVRSWRYLLGVGLDGLGFVLSVAAVRSLPLFVVQSIVASFLAVTAVVEALVLHVRLARGDRLAIGVVVGGLALVGLSATEDRTVDVSGADQWGILLAAVALVGIAAVCGRLRAGLGVVALGAVAGLAFGATAVAARMIPGSLALGALVSDPRAVLGSPASYALLVAGALAMVAYPTALQRGSVTQATAPLVVGETLAPAVVGIALLGDEPRPGWEWVAVLGFALAVGGAIGLSRHGEVA